MPRAMNLLGPGIPMFFMGEEVGASRPYRYDDFINAREDYYALRQGPGANLFRFYRDLIRLRLSHPALRSPNIDIIYRPRCQPYAGFPAMGGERRAVGCGQPEQYLFYRRLRLFKTPLSRDGQWREIFNSDAAAYGGSGLANQGLIPSTGGEFTVRVPANGVLVFQRQG